MQPVTLGTMRLGAQQKAGMENSLFLTTAEWNSLINSGLHKAYSEVANAWGEEFVATATLTGINGAADTFALPFNFQRLTGVDSTFNGFTTSLRAFQFRERNMYKNPGYSAAFARPMYRLQGQNIHLIPAPPAGTTITLWFVPTPPTLVNDSDTVDDLWGTVQFAVWDAVSVALEKEESDPGYAVQQREAARQRIIDTAPMRDAADAPRITDVTNSEAPYGAWGGWQ